MEKQQEQPNHVVDQTQPADLHEVRITFLRIQTYLLAVPRLREMVGSNVQLGEVIRRQLLRLAKNCGAECPQNQLPSSAFFSQAIPQGIETALATAPNADPLGVTGSSLDRDQPDILLKHWGVTARDGGHFAAIFTNKQRAKAFARQAKAHLRRKLPGLPYEVKINSTLSD